MQFIFYDPFKKVVGKELELSISSPVSLRTLIERLPDNLLKMIRHDPSISDIDLWAHVWFFTGKKLLRLDEIIDNDATIHVFLPAWGG